MNQDINYRMQPKCMHYVGRVIRMDKNRLLTWRIHVW